MILDSDSMRFIKFVNKIRVRILVNLAKMYLTHKLHTIFKFICCETNFI